MAERNENDTDWYSVKVRIEASYVVIVPANSEEEATREAYRADVPAGKLYDVDKTVVQCGPSCNEILRRAEERPAFRGRKPQDSPTS
jgi:hypothetical protein